MQYLPSYILLTATEDILFDCLPDEVVFFSHADDCTKYYECFNGTIYEMVCPDEMHFNDEVSTCDLPELAKCEVSKPENEERKWKQDEFSIIYNNYCIFVGTYSLDSRIVAFVLNTQTLADLTNPAWPSIQ